MSAASLGASSPCASSVRPGLKTSAAVSLASIRRTESRLTFPRGVRGMSATKNQCSGTASLRSPWLDAAVASLGCLGCHRLISERTARKANGGRLGNPRNIAAAGEIGRKVQTNIADEFAALIIPVVDVIRRTGAQTLEAIAIALNKQGLQTARGKKWRASSVANLLVRANKPLKLDSVQRQSFYRRKIYALDYSPPNRPQRCARASCVAQLREEVTGLDQADHREECDKRLTPRRPCPPHPRSAGALSGPKFLEARNRTTDAS